MNTAQKQPSKHSELVLNALKQATSKEIEKKRRLGQYVVLWENGKVITKVKMLQKFRDISAETKKIDLLFLFKFSFLISTLPCTNKSYWI